MSPPPKVLAILDRACAGSDEIWLAHLTELVAGLPRDGQVWLQLRAKRMPVEKRRLLLRVARAISSEREELPILVNGTSGQALEIGFSGVHWPEALRPAEPPVTASRLRHVSAATHDLKGARGALRAGAQVITWSPVFDPGSKVAPGRGTAALAKFVRSSPLPVIALGGIRPDRVRVCLQSGAVGVAVLSAVSAPGARPLRAVEALLTQAA